MVMRSCTGYFFGRAKGLGDDGMQSDASVRSTDPGVGQSRRGWNNGEAKIGRHGVYIFPPLLRALFAPDPVYECTSVVRIKASNHLHVHNVSEEWNRMILKMLSNPSSGRPIYHLVAPRGCR